jgi:UDP-N-acetylglucosamine transferase subunit ALG13
MIFVTVGTERFAFERLLKAIDNGIRDKEITDDVFAQIGTSSYIPEFYEHRRFLSFGQMTENINKADIVVTHAGVGSTLLCLTLGNIPILFPRLQAKGEHLDDHQIEFTTNGEREENSLGLQ